MQMQHLMVGYPKYYQTADYALRLSVMADIATMRMKALHFWDKHGICSGQQKLATALEFFQYRFSDSFGGNPPLYSCGLSAL